MFASNRFLITGGCRELNGFLYYGIETDPWPVPEENLHLVFDGIQLESFEEQTDDLLSADDDVRLVNFETAKLYARHCAENKFDFRVLYIEAPSKNIGFDVSLHRTFACDKSFLGYDVGVCAFDYYSSLLSDVIARPELLGEEIFKSLNCFGLFGTIADAEAYIKRRSRAVASLPELMFEKGKMQILSLYSADEII